MPLIKVKKGSRTCYKFGKDGKLYCGVGAKEKVLKQGRAIEANKKAKNK